MNKKMYLAIIEFYWWLEHRRSERLAVIGYRNRKLWEKRYVRRFKENIYGQPFDEQQ
jgi:hypothetical protein